MTHSPVAFIPADSGRDPEPGVALCLSGGGYRAMLFHVGAVWRLHQAGILDGLNRVSSVSGGSITAGWLGVCWSKLYPKDPAQARGFEETFVNPLRDLASKSVDWKAILKGATLPGSAADFVARAYDRLLFRGARLGDLPDDDAGPRFVINATNVQSGALWRFSRPYMRDWRVGEVKSPDLKLAVAVAASSAFPPFLSPLVLSLDPDDFTPDSGHGLQKPPYTSEVVLTDGGVYDNLGLETAFKRYRTVLVSDAGGVLAPSPEPGSDWVSHTARTISLIDSQVRALRKRQLIDALTERPGTYWSIRSQLADYPIDDTLDVSPERAQELAEVPTRLTAMDPTLQERLINWGYAVSDTALRAHYTADLPKGALHFVAAGI